VDEILKETWQSFKKEKSTLADQKTLGGRLMLQLAAISRILYANLLEKGKSEQEATKLVFQISWKIYTRMGKYPMLFAKIRSNNPLQKVALSTQFFRKFPFSSPDYGWEDIASEEGIVAFNCTRCQVAEYFKHHQLGEFCYETWCKLDFPLAEQWGAELNRKASIAIGAPECDFRWSVPLKNL
jgi:ubiquinone biosynthesis protein